jgi:hypothetical protein
MRKLFTLVAMLFLSVTMFAQITTSNMSGRITDKTGSTLPGATVVATHTPSGTTYGTTSNAEGRYTIQGMRVGGPYTIEVRYIGFVPSKQEGITLKLGETYRANFVLQEDAVGLTEVVISAEATEPVRNSSSTTINTEEIAALPSINRSITDVVKISPYANGMSFAGSDGRSTNFTVDGANFNNNFGLSSNLPGGGTPISLDAIEEIQVLVAPFDVRQSNFVGGGINAITKSGTNMFKGSAYSYYTNQSLRGNILAGEDLGERQDESKLVYGATVGGPIVKDKLFFFVNFEKQDEPTQEIQYRPNVAEAAQLDLVKNKLMQDYGYDPGSYTNYPGGINNIKILARVDWNINLHNKMTVRFNKTNNTTWYAPNGNSCDDNFRNRNYNRSSETSFPFSYNMYSQKNNVTSFAGELNSRISDEVSNQFIATYTNIDDRRGSESDIFPHIDIMTGDLSTGNYVPFTSLGYELFTYNNGVTNKVINASDNLTIYKGNHKITAGASWERQTASNSYMRNGTGYYRFASVDDFLNNARPLSFCLTYGNNGVKEPRGIVTYNQVGLYAQDEWSINEDFRLNFGLRGDGLFFDNNDLMTNNAILNYDMGGRSVNTGKWPNNSIQVSPRIGFNWDILGNNSLTLRGGSGIFQGRLPLVFFTNMPQNAGMIQTLISYSGSLDDGNLIYSDEVIAALDNLYQDGKLVVDVDQMINALGINTTVTPEDGQLPRTINGVDPNFKMPQIWKTSLGVDYNVPVSFPLTLTLEGLFNKTIYGVRLVDWNLNDALINDATDANRFAGPDNRVNYNSFDSYTYGSSNAYVLTNSREGYGYTLNFTVNASPVKHLNVMAAYTHTESKEISGMPGSNAYSAYSGLYSINGPSFVDIQRSQYVVPDKIMANISYLLPFNVFHGNGLKLGMYFTAYSPGAYSYIFSNDMNGDGISTDLLYIPNTKDEILFTTTADADAFWAFVEQDEYLSSHKGQYAEAYAGRSPWISYLDLRLSEDFSVKVGKRVHNLELSVNVDNMLNIFNSKWGVYKYGCFGSTSTIAPLKFEGVNANNQPIYSMNKITVGEDAEGNAIKEYPTETFNQYYTGSNSQCWSILLGLKYSF